MIPDSISKVEAIPQEMSLKATTFQMMQCRAGQLKIDMMKLPNKQDNEEIHRTISPSGLCEPEPSSGTMEAVEIYIYFLPQNVASLRTFKGKGYY